MTGATEPQAAALDAVLENIGKVAVAVSGGVDSMTLAVIAGRRLGQAAAMLHAVSPAVPPEASQRVRAYAAREGWRLEVIDAGEFSDANYLKNPANRCFFCKTNLYGTIAERTRATICSGTNLDDLADWRPGLEAAKSHGVRHPYVEAGIDKAGVRALARRLGLDDLAELPAAPCLSSRLETGIPVTAERLRLVHAVERLIQQAMAPQTVRCRVLQDGLAIQLDVEALARIQSASGAPLRRNVERLLAAHGHGSPVRYQPYRMGSAFHRPAADG
jgi:pyridinium-3,5-biscarboxylic acid mononucleotide sulfurtransferase